MIHNKIVVVAAAVAFRVRSKFHNSVEIERQQYLLGKCVIKSRNVKIEIMVCQSHSIGYALFLATLCLLDIIIVIPWKQTIQDVCGFHFTANATVMVPIRCAVPKGSVYISRVY